MNDASRNQTISGRLIRAGVRDVSRAKRLLEDKALVNALGDIFPEHALIDALSLSSDPDQGLLGTIRLFEAFESSADPALRPYIDEFKALYAPPLYVPAVAGTSIPISAFDQGDEAPRLLKLRRIYGVLGHSTALLDEVVRRPELIVDLLDTSGSVGIDAREIRSLMLRSVDADPLSEEPVAGEVPSSQPCAIPSCKHDLDLEADEQHKPNEELHKANEVAHFVGAFRREYRRLILRIAATDMASDEPLSIMPAVAAALADLAAGALEAALAIARFKHPTNGQGARISVVGMGKTGGRELNYISDVDVIYVVEPQEGTDEDVALAVGTQLAMDLQSFCASPGSEPMLWQVDPALRPEGKQGPLVRTLASHFQYYDRWAKTWEFQALLKARHVAGDAALTAEYLEHINPLVWQAVTRENFVEDAQAMRRRVENHVKPAEADRQIKLGKGGLRDVEFTVQLLQLVHARMDDSIRSANTLTALASLASAGYVGREHAADLAICYRFLRSLEHRIQLRNLHRTHLMPSSETELEVMARAVGIKRNAVEGLLERWRSTKRSVRSLHEALFYRPLLPATASLSTEEAALAPEAAAARLRAIGYKDPNGALRHIVALTEGVSRRAKIQRQLLPVMLGWFAEGPNPDAGLLSFRKLSEQLGGTHWYLKLLRDSGTAAQRLATVLSTSTYVAEAISDSPLSITWFDNTADLQIRSRESLEVEIDAILTRSDEPKQAITTIRGIRRRELARIASAELLTDIAPRDAAQGITDAADILLAGALRIARWETLKDKGLDLASEPADFAIIAMGRMGGREMGYGSDADVMFVFHPRSGVSEGDAGKYAQAVAVTIRRLLTEANPEPPLEVDADLRPEGRNGPLVRSFESYAEYYGRWSEAWESQALLRARPVAGQVELGAAFMRLIDPLRYPQAGLDAATVRDIRRIKARVESERLPRGVHPSRHLKLGRGGIADVEWLVQLLALQYGAVFPDLQTTETIAGLDAAEAASLIDSEDAVILKEAWQRASLVRDALVLYTGRTTGAQVDVLPSDRGMLEGIARVLKYQAGEASILEEDYLRGARRARKVMERLFYGESQ